MQGIVWIEPDEYESMLHMEGQAQCVEGMLQGELGRPNACGGSVFAKVD